MGLWMTSLCRRSTQMPHLMLPWQVTSKDETIAALESDLKTADQGPPLPSEAAGPAAALSLDDMDAKGKEAASGRLRRMCQMRNDGSLAVPLAIHNQWKEGGAGRKKLLSLFVSLNFDRERAWHEHENA